MAVAVMAVSKRPRRLGGVGASAHALLGGPDSGSRKEWYFLAQAWGGMGKEFVRAPDGKSRRTASLKKVRLFGA